MFRTHKEVPLSAVETGSGEYVDVVSPDPDTIKLDDIARALSRVPRFLGHTLGERIWSVAQHSVFVESILDCAFQRDALWDSLVNWIKTRNSDLLPDLMAVNFDPRRVRLLGLLHDASEAYLTDLPTPIKKQPGIKEAYSVLERRMQMTIFTALQVEQPASELEVSMVLWADLVALAIEAGNLMPSRGAGWHVDFPLLESNALGLMPLPKSPSENQAEFISVFKLLTQFYRH